MNWSASIVWPCLPISSPSSGPLTLDQQLVLALLDVDAGAQPEMRGDPAQQLARPLGRLVRPLEARPPPPAMRSRSADRGDAHGGLVPLAAPRAPRSSTCSTVEARDSGARAPSSPPTWPLRRSLPRASTRASSPLRGRRRLGHHAQPPALLLPWRRAAALLLRGGGGGCFLLRRRPRPRLARRRRRAAAGGAPTAPAAAVTDVRTTSCWPERPEVGRDPVDDQAGREVRDSAANTSGSSRKIRCCVLSAVAVITSVAAICDADEQHDQDHQLRPMRRLGDVVDEQEARRRRTPAPAP